ncbi:hypothetical protein F183_A45110 [Bryobacterales bacterium F-183]|nr:hypothetical protein F183_A45110 [Bryobacterales bacterium F-183]
MPILTLVAGPNGSGKSTITASLLLKGRENLVDPDAIARQIDPEDPLRASVSAGREAIHRCRGYIDEQCDFILESTLAGNWAVNLLRQAKAAGFRIIFIYVALENADLNIERVRRRVAEGGHDVPDADIRRRYVRSMEQCVEALKLADEAILIDNSHSNSRRIATVMDAKLIWEATELPAWAKKILLDLR